MSASKYPSKVNLPQINTGFPTVLDFLIHKFPGIAESVWRNRVAEGKVHWSDSSPITAETPFQPQRCVWYYREVEKEPTIPFLEDILFQDDHLLVVDKPHFLPVTPGGVYVNECLQNRLRHKTGNDDLQALHRLDRETAGLMLFSINPETRKHYHELFAKRTIHKSYQAVAAIQQGDAEIQQGDAFCGKELCGNEWQVENQLIRSEPRFLMKIGPGEVNARSTIRCVAQTAEKALFHLFPITGKTHQLRIHMQGLGYPILNDKYYPTLQAKTDDDFSRPLQLLAKELSFIDPLTQISRTFRSNRKLDW